MQSQISYFIVATGCTEHDAAAIVRRLNDGGFILSKAPRARAPKCDKPTGQRFVETLGQAQWSAVAQHGPNWHLAPGARVFATIPASMATYKFRRADGSLSIPIKLPRSMGIPAPEFWQGRALPVGVELEHEDTTPCPRRAAFRAEVEAWAQYKLARCVMRTVHKHDREERSALVTAAADRRREWYAASAELRHHDQPQQIAKAA